MFNICYKIIKIIIITATIIIIIIIITITIILTIILIQIIIIIIMKCNLSQQNVNDTMNEKNAFWPAKSG